MTLPPPTRPANWPAVLLAVTPAIAFASSGPEASGGARTFLWLAIMLIAAKLATLVQRFGQPAVLGEIVVGVVLGNLGLAGIGFLESAADDVTLRFLAELGAVVLLFQIGLESNVQGLRRVGGRALWVATIGVVAPFILGSFVVGPWLFPDAGLAGHLFLGAALTATSVGITGRVFRDAGALERPEAQIVLGAAVIDDVLGLVILSVVSSIASTGTVGALQVGATLLQAVAFLGLALVLGKLLAPRLGRAFARIHPGVGMKLTVAVGLCFLFAWAAHAIGLAPIVGAFAAGLILDEVHFRHFDDPTIKTDLLAAIAASDGPTQSRVRRVIDRHSEKHLEHLLEPIGHFLVPIFFVLAGMQVKLSHFADPGLLVVAGAISVVAILGKLAAGTVAGDVDRWLVGWGMVPRGEVGLIFAFVGRSIGVVSDALFSVIVFVVMVTTLATPPVLAWLLRRTRVRSPAPLAPVHGEG